MNELIPLQPQTINGNAVETVSARELHSFLESKQDFSTWIKNRISEYDFIENQDFVCFHKKMEANNATMIEYTYHEISDPRFGKVKCYHNDILTELFQMQNLL